VPARGRRPRRLRPDLEHGRAEPWRPCSMRCPARSVQRTFDRYWRNFQARRKRRSGGRSPWRRRLHALRVAQRRRVRSPRRAGAGPGGHGLLPCRPPAEGMEPVGGGRGARSTRAAFSRRHAAWMGRVRPDPFRARSSLPTRTRASPPSCWLPASPWLGCVARDCRFASFGRPTGRLSWTARVGADGAIDVRVSGLQSFRAVV
jgi:hypothetical protein